MLSSQKQVLSTLKEVTQTTVQSSCIWTDLMVTSRFGLSNSNQCGSPTLLSRILCETLGQILVPYHMLSPGSLIKRRFGIGMCLATYSIGKSTFSPNLGVPKFLSCLEQELHTELVEVSKLEEELWAMKLRITWLVEGDRNTGFYHTSALVCRSRNRINCLKDNMGNWLTDESDIADYIRTGFASLFMTSHSSSLHSLWYPPCWSSCLQDDEIAKLAALISDEEIASALWSLQAFKAPGSNGLHAGFFQRFWLLVGDSVKAGVKHIFTSLSMPEYLNRTLITLIPKCNAPKSLSNYRPISLCNTVYKIVTKMIMARIRPILPHLVSPY